MRMEGRMNLDTQVAEIIETLATTADRIGAEKDEPEGARYIQISDTCAKQMARTLQAYVDRR